MRGTGGRPFLGSRRGGSPVQRFVASFLMIAGLLLVVAGTVLAYSEWQAQANVPESFGPDAESVSPRAEAVLGREDEPDLAERGAVILPPMELVPQPPALPDPEWSVAIPLLRREGAAAGPDEARRRRALAAEIPRVPSWVDSTFSQGPRAPGTPDLDSQDGESYPPTLGARPYADALRADAYNGAHIHSGADGHAQPHALSRCQ